MATPRELFGDISAEEAEEILQSKYGIKLPEPTKPIKDLTPKEAEEVLQSKYGIKLPELPDPNTFVESLGRGVDVLQLGGGAGLEVFGAELKDRDFPFS